MKLVDNLPIKHFEICDYKNMLKAMLAHIAHHPPCEIWMLEHHPVYTRGRRTTEDHIKTANTIPIVDTDRGGQLTYHGPGQLIVYPLLNLQRWQFGPLELVDILEQTTVNALAHYHIDAMGDPHQRGVYIEGKKIASIGLKIKQHYSYHGIAINLDMDLSPFDAIVPCGNPDMQMTQLSEYANPLGFKDVWLNLLLANLQEKRYTERVIE